MAILAFQKPEKVIMLESDNYKGVFEFRPLEPGFGMTIGNALRRPIYRQVASYGHFGRNDLLLPWENTDKAEILKKQASSLK